MTPFLESIAQAYFHNERQNLVDTCFVFANRRSIIYFSDYLHSIAKKEKQRIILPQITTIVDFTESFSSDSVAAERMEMIFILFNIYRNVVGEVGGPDSAEAVDFNKFIQWADVLLNDFDDVDQALADPDKIFLNVEELKEISTNYLTPEQIELLGHYFDTDRLRCDMEQFWSHIPHEADSKQKTSQKFLRIWQVLGEVYRRFIAEMKHRGMHTPGMSVRKAAETIKSMGINDFKMNRYVFVGFDTLTVAQLSIMKQMARLKHDDGSPLADFYWDLASPAFHGDRHPEGVRAVAGYAHALPSLYDCAEHIDEFPPIDIIGVPSRIGQAKAIGSILNSKFKFDSSNDVENTPELDSVPHNQQLLRNTAIVLPEETLLPTLLSSIPESVADINITMGYKLRNTAVAGLLREINLMQKRATSGVANPVFFYEDVIRVLSNPIVQQCSPNLCVSIILEIQRRRIFSISPSFFEECGREVLKPLFTYIPALTSPKQIFSYQRKIVEWLTDVLSMQHEPEALPDDSLKQNIIVEQISQSALAVQKAFLKGYLEALAHLDILCSNYLPADIPLEKLVAFSMIDRMVQGETLSFNGVPLKGLQIMGVLEARSLDFDTIIIPSMNERVFPRARFTASFIPHVIRKAYGIATADDEENVYTYRFYRMISRAKKVYLLYDARSSGRRTQPSRYIHQLQNIYRPNKLRRSTFAYSLRNPEEKSFIVKKTPEIMARLKEFLPEGGTRNLSASSIKLYLKCPMSFYLSYIAGYNREDRISEWIDESTFGTIVHEVLENVYGSLLEQSPKGVLVNEATIDSLLNRSNTLIANLTTRAINRNFLNLPEEKLDVALTGQNRLIANIVIMYVCNTLRRDRENTPFTYLHGEWGDNDSGPLTLIDEQGNSLTFNFTARIDRIDRIVDEFGAQRIRIIDYKTGSDIANLVTFNKALDDYKTISIVQLMLYAAMYAARTGYAGPIQPMLYSMRQMVLNPIQPYRISEAPSQPNTDIDPKLKSPKHEKDKWKILDYREYIAQLNSLLLPKLKELFDPDVPFVCSDDKADCSHCLFSSICNRD